MAARPEAKRLRPWAPTGVGGPTPPSEPPPLSCLVEVLEQTSGFCRREYHECITVQVDTAHVDINGSSDDNAQYMSALEKVPGRYWKIGALAQGQQICPVFRQEAASGDEPNDMELFIFRFDVKGSKSWWICNHVSVSEHDLTNQPCKKNADNDVVKVLAWADASKHEQDFCPSVWHIPFWSKKPNQHVVGGSLVNFLESALEGASLDIDAQAAELSRVQSQSEASASAPAKAAAKASGANKPSGGWMKKSAKLVAAVLQEKWDEVSFLADEFAQAPLMDKLVSAAMEDNK